MEVPNGEEAEKIPKGRWQKSILIVLNDNAQDGTDVSWIYDTFFEKLMKNTTKRIIVSGSRC